MAKKLSEKCVIWHFGNYCNKRGKALKIILKLSLLLILITQSFGAKYTHDDFHKDITEIESEMKNM